MKAMTATTREDHRGNPSHDAGYVRLIDLVRPEDPDVGNRLLGGAALLAASRYGRTLFVTESSDAVDFGCAGQVGELIEATGRVIRIGVQSLDVEVELFAESFEHGEQRLCSRGRFTMVPIHKPVVLRPLPQLSSVSAPGHDGVVRTIDMTSPSQGDSNDFLCGHHALEMMGKSAYIVAKRYCRAAVFMTSCDRIDFKIPVKIGELAEMTAKVETTTSASVIVSVTLVAENLRTGERRGSASATFTIGAVDREGRPKEIRRRYNAAGSLPDVADLALSA
jgi:acyl-CoA hydrolase